MQIVVQSDWPLWALAAVRVAHLDSALLESVMHWIARDAETQGELVD